MIVETNSITKKLSYGNERVLRHGGTQSVLHRSPRSLHLQHSSVRRHFSVKNARTDSKSEMVRKVYVDRYCEAHPINITTPFSSNSGGKLKSSVVISTQRKSQSCTLIDSLQMDTGESAIALCCAWCLKKFSSRSKLVLHSRICAKVRCLELKKKATYMINQIAHDRVQSRKMNISTSDNSEQFSFMSKPNENLRPRPDKMSVICKSGNLSNKHHYVNRQAETGFSCEKCGKSFRYQSNFNDHLKMQCDKMDFTCKRCGEAFRSEVELSLHRIVHQNDTVSCIICGRKLSSRASLRRHLRYHSTPSDEPSLACNETSLPNETCEVSESNVGPQVRSAIPDTATFHCVDCGKTFSSQSDLVEHLKVHGGQGNEISFAYETSGKVFKSNVDLKKHQVAKRKPVNTFRCFKCGKSFSSRYQLRKHDETHFSPEKFIKTPSSQGNQTLLTYKTFGMVSKSNNDPVKSQLTHQPINFNCLNFNCLECGKLLGSVSHLCEHFKVHNDQASQIDSHSPAKRLEKFLSQIST